MLDGTSAAAKHFFHDTAIALRTPLAGEIWLVLLMLLVVVWTFVK